MNHPVHMPASLHWLIKWAQTNLALAFGEMNLAFLCQCYKYPDKNLFELKWNYGLNLLLLILKRNKSFSLTCMTDGSDNTRFRESKRIYPELKMGFTLWEVQQSTTACYKKASEKNDLFPCLGSISWPWVDSWAFQRRAQKKDV